MQRGLSAAVCFVVVGILADPAETLHPKEQLLPSVASSKPLFRWSTPLTTSHNATFGEATLLPNLGLVVTLVVDLGKGDRGNDDTSLVALNVTTGTTLWHRPMTFIQAASGWVAASERTLFVGTDTGVVAVDCTAGQNLWEHAAAVQQVPSHPTYFAGLVFFTFENGVDSSGITALNATTGNTVWSTTDRAFSKIWVTEQGLLVYQSLNLSLPRSQRVGVVARRPGNGEVVWSHYSLPTTHYNISLNNNPNLDVAQGNVFMYSKPTDDLREITMFDAKTGARLWTLPTRGDIGDYDTFAYKQNFFRLVSQPGTNTFLMDSHDASERVVWSVVVEGTDMNANLLVGDGAAFMVAIDTNRVLALDAATGSKLWEVELVGPNDGVTGEGVLYIGDSTGVLHAIEIGAK